MLSEVVGLLGSPGFNWSDPAPWIALEQEFGIEFPADFREVLDAYGSIEINRQLYLKHPAGHFAHNLGDAIRNDRELWREEGMSDFLPGQVGAGPGELMPVASAMTGETVFLRVPDGLSLAWRVVVQEFDSFSWDVYEMTFVEWFLAYLRGDDVTICSRNWAPDRPFFEALP